MATFEYKAELSTVSLCIDQPFHGFAMTALKRTLSPLDLFFPSRPMIHVEPDECMYKV